MEQKYRHYNKKLDSKYIQVYRNVSENILLSSGLNDYWKRDGSEATYYFTMWHAVFQNFKWNKNIATTIRSWSASCLTSVVWLSGNTLASINVVALCQTRLVSGACRRKWQLTDTDLCPCGETQTMSHIVESCPLTKLNGGLSRLHSADEDAVSWLTNYGKWHAYEKKKKYPDGWPSVDG